MFDYKKVLEDNPNPFFVVEPISDEKRDFKYVYVNEAFEKLINVPKDKLIGNTYFSLFNDYDEVWLSLIHDTVSLNKPYIIEDDSLVINKHLVIQSFAVSEKYAALEVLNFSLIGDYELEAENKRLWVEANTDFMTGLYNRLYLNRYLNNEEELRNYGVILFDLNDLKYINDTFGHEYGDKHIIEFSKFLKGSLKTAELYRYGGDEFLAIFNNIRDDEFFEIVKNVKESLNKTLVSAIGSDYVYSNEKDLKLALKKSDYEMYLYKKWQKEQKQKPKTRPRY